PDFLYLSLFSQMEKSMNPLRPYERIDTRRQFLDNDSKVLRFYGYWDDSSSLFGDVRDLVLHYFLVDDTIEIREVIAPNCGRDHVSKFLRRSKLPKLAPSGLLPPGAVTPRAVLNVFDSNQGKRFILDSLKTGAVKQEFYKDSDLTIGTELNVWGRRVTITDCDEFTKNYYRSKYGIEDFTPVQYKAPAAPKPSRYVPPYNGFGSEEDSLSSCQGLVPKPPQKDFHKFMTKDRDGLESHVLNFEAKMVTENPVDKDRVFIISFYLRDDTISVFEKIQKNSGVLGGAFLQRGRVKKPGQDQSQRSQYFTAQDFYVGAVLCLNKRNFQLIEADEYTLNYMEQHADEFARADVGSILSKLRSISDDKQREIQTFLTLSDPSGSGFIHYEPFRGLLMGLECGLSEHEVLVLSRCFSEPERSELDVGLMLAVAQHFLRKEHFENFSELTKALTHRDRHRMGYLSLKETRTICKSFSLPLPETLLTPLLQKFAQGDDLDYHAFVTGINWVEHPAAPVMPEDILKTSDSRGAVPRNISSARVLRDVFPGPLNSTDPTTAAS
uniref:EF-hand domain-containing family member C2 n=1 Tax=Periophthalmus magnuspinnatus TaxID=409849 RepID=A0A3B4AFN7_9GOBI